MATPGRTWKMPNSPFGVKWFFKPSLGKVIGRISGVNRRSASVLAVNEVLEDLAGKPNHPATVCGGEGAWKDFVKCLRREMKNLMKNTKAQRESRAAELARKYGIPISTKKTPKYIEHKIGAGMRALE